MKDLSESISINSVDSNNLTIFSNYTYIRSVVDMTNVIGYPTKTRSLQGQSPYIINAGIQYQDNERNFSVSTSLNRVGDRISIVGSVLEPDIRENGRTFIDFQVAKSFLKNRLEIKYNLRDALAQNQNFYQDANANQKFDKNIDAVIWQTRFAQTHSFAISFKF